MRRRKRANKQAGVGKEASVEEVVVGWRQEAERAGEREGRRRDAETQTHRDADPEGPISAERRRRAGMGIWKHERDGRTNEQMDRRA